MSETHDSTAATEGLRALVASARNASEGPVERYLQLAWEAVEAVTEQLERDGGRRSGALLGAALVELGEAQRRASDIRGAVESLEQAVEVASDLLKGDAPSTVTERWHALAHHRLGIVHDTVGDAGRAIAALRRALELYDDDGDSVGTARVHNSLAIVYSRAGSYPEALERFEASLDAALLSGQHDRQAAVLSNLAITNRLLGRVDAAVDCASRAVELAEAIDGAVAMLGAAYTNLALALAAAGDDAGASHAFEVGHRHHSTAGDIFNLAEHLRCQGEFLLERSQLDAALPLLTRSLALAQEHGYETLQAAAHERLAQLYKARGEFECALAEHERFHSLMLATERATAVREREAQQVLAELAVARVEAQAAKREREALAAQYARLAADHDALTGRAAQLELDATRDGLTGLANRRLFDARLAETLARAQASGSPCSLVLIDADHFKRINDTHGHMTGDRILVHIARTLQTQLRERDLAARLGGEEFAVLLPDTDQSGALKVAEKLRAAIEALRWPDLGPDASVSASLGVASASEGVLTAFDLVALADQRLYAAKAAGRNRVEPQPQGRATP